MNELNSTKIEDQQDKLQMQKINPFLWFENQSEDAAKFYVSVFKNSKINTITRYGKEGYEIHKMKEGTVMTVDFEIEGQRFIAPTVVQCLNSMNQFLFKLIVIPKKKWTIIGKNFLKEAMKKPNNVDG